MAKSLDIIDPKRELQEEEEETRNIRSDEDDFKMNRPEKEGGSGVFYLVLGIIAIIVATGAALYILYKDYLPGKNDPNNASATVTASTSITQTTSTTVSPSATASASSFEYTDQKIRIANGNGISGEATKVKELLNSKGFEVESVGNASKTYTETIIYYKAGQENLANALKEAISSMYTGNIEESNTVVGIYDAVIALGSK